MKEVSGNSNPSGGTPVSSSPPLTLVFDATILANGEFLNSGRSGIYVVAYELLREMCRDPGLRILLYCSPGMILSLRRVLSTGPFGRDLPIVNDNEASLQGDRFRSLLQGNAAEGGKLRRKLRQLGVYAFKVMEMYRRRHSWRQCRPDAADLFFSPMLAAPDAVRRAKIPLYYFVHDTIVQCFPEQFPQLKLGLCWQQRLFESLDDTTFVFANSGQTRRDLLRFFPAQDPAKTHVVPLAAPPRFEPCDDAGRLRAVRDKYQIPAEVPYLLSVCTLEPRKNLLFSLRNFLNYLSNHPDCPAYFVLAGGHAFSFAVPPEIAASPRILRVGYVPDEDLPLLYAGARATLYPSRYEGFGLPVLEAMQCGSPVITSNVSSLPEVAGDAAVMLDPEDDQAMQHAIGELLQNDEVCAAMRAAGLKQAGNFCWAKSAGMIAEILKQRKVPPVIDLLIATCGRTAELRRLLESLRRQTCRNFNILICDQNEDDRLAFAEEEFADLPLRRFRLRPASVSNARNLLLDQATAPFFAFPDDDCVYEPDTVASALDFFRRHPGADGCFGKWIAFGEEQWGDRPQKAPERLNCYSCFLHGGALVQFFRATPAIRRLRFDPAFGFGAGIRYVASEDTDFVLQLLSQKGTLYRADAIHIRHKAGDFSVRDASRIRAYNVSRIVLLKKYNKHFFALAMVFYPLLRMAAKPKQCNYFFQIFLGRLKGIFTPYRKEPPC